MRFSFVIALLFAAGNVVFCQEPPTNTQIKNMLDVSQRRGQLETEGSPPFHLVASYEWFDSSGMLLGKGSIDELWESPKRYRQALNISGKQLLEVDDGTRAWRTGEWVEPELVAFGLKSVVTPFIERPAGDRLDRGENPKEGDNLDCFNTEPDLPGVSRDIPLAATMYCLGKGNHLLRMISRPNAIKIAFNDIQLARKIQVSKGGASEVRMHVDVLEPATDFLALEKAPPPDAQMLGFHRADIPVRSGELMHAQPFKKEGLTFPNGSDGRVVVRVHIDTTGSVDSAEIISADNQTLKAPALVAANAWRFRAAYRDGKVMDDTQTIVFMPASYTVQ